LITLGLLISIPLIVFGSQLVLRVLNRFPIMVVLGGGLLGWIAGEIIVSDPFVHSNLPYDEHFLRQVAEPTLALLVMLAGVMLSKRARARAQDVIGVAPEDQS
jgi:predicted tellurium resistance membrane protein TerC